MPSLAFRKASICSRFSFSASCTLVVNPQHATRSRLILYWKLPPPSGSSCIGKDCAHRWGAACGSKVSLLDAVAERFAPGLSPRAEALFAGIAVPLGTVRTNTAPAQYISLLRELQKLVRRQTPVRDLRHGQRQLASALCQPPVGSIVLAICRASRASSAMT